MELHVDFVIVYSSVVQTVAARSRSVFRLSSISSFEMRLEKSGMQYTLFGRN